MLDAFRCLLCSKLCWHNRPVPIHDEKARPGINTTPQMRHVKPAKCIVSMNGDHYYDT